MFELLSGLRVVVGWIGWLGVGVAPVLVAAAVIWFVPPFRQLAIMCAAGWLLVFGAWTVGDHGGASRVTRQWAAANAVAAERAREADALVAANAENAEARDVVVEADADKENAEARNAYIAELEKRLAGSKSGVCRLDDSDVGRLRNIR